VINSFVMCFSGRVKDTFATETMIRVQSPDEDNAVCRLFQTGCGFYLMIIMFSASRNTINNAHCHVRIVVVVRRKFNGKEPTQIFDKTDFRSYLTKPF